MRPYGTAVLGHSLDEHLDVVAEQRLVSLQGDAALDVEEVVEAALLLDERHVVGPARGRGAGSYRVRLDVDDVIADVAEQLNRALELCFRLAAEADDDVGGQGQVGDGGHRGGDLLAVLGDAVDATHAAKELIVTGLHREVELFAHRGEVTHRLEELRHRVARMRGEEAQPAQPGNGVDRSKQLGQPGARLRIAVAVDVLAEQRDLAHAATDQPLHVVDDLAGGAAALAPAHERHDAVACTSHCIRPSPDVRREGGPTRAW